MKKSLNNLTGYTIQAIDGPKGKVKDFLFDEEGWIVRYLEADYGKLFKDKKVLIPRVFLKEPQWENKYFPVDLTRENIESCPDLDERKPVSREYEKVMSRHYSIDYYWPYSYPATAATGMYFPPRPLRIPSKIIDEKDLDTSLRSFREVKGYYVRATDKRLGHIEDLVVDDEDWQIVYVVVDTSNWLPWGKKVMLPIDWLEEISYVNREVSIGLPTETIRNAPEFDGRHPLELDFEKALYDFYDKAFVK